MKKTIFITILLCLTVGSLSAKKKNKLPKTETDSVAVVVENDTTRSIYVFPMISVGDVTFSTDSEKELAMLEQSNASDSVLFKGLDKKQIIDFFVQNVVYPNELKQKAAEDYLKIRFDVDKDGNVKNPKVLNSTYPEMEKEVLRVAIQLSDYEPVVKNTKTKKNKKKNKEQRDTTVEVPISFRILKL